MNDHLSPRRRVLWRVARWVLAVAVVIAVVYWFEYRAVTVVGHVVQRGDVVAEVMGTGTLEARVQATISPKISGLITGVLADQGDEVKAGQILARLDDRDLRQQAQAAEASVAAAQAALERLKADKARAAAVLEQAGRDHERLVDLFRRQSAASVEVDKAVEAFRVAQADVTRAEAAIVEGQKNLIASEETLEYHRARLADTTVTAPFAGLIVRRDRDPGDVVVPGSAIMVLISLEEIWVSAWVDESAMSQLRPGQPAKIVFRSEPDRSYGGQVARLGRETDRETREFLVDVRVGRLPENWAVGQRAEVYIETARRSAVTLLPSAFVLRREGQEGTVVLAARRSQWRGVTLGLRGRDVVEVIEGLEPGDTLIRARDAKGTTLQSGRRVKVQ
ncbi:MAG: efflux RND transporter periplasmic adaptor subunit [Phycisphaerae bacterium]|nr:efflux RND transporter periplasmic adaptor subunit [Phycisphaerae bacterium]